MPAGDAGSISEDPMTHITIPTLNDGERYAGLILDETGQPTHHLILLPGDTSDVTWEQAKAWATEIGGELPTRQEQALLYANAKQQFERDWYWSGQQHESDSACAWCQDFLTGDQYLDLLSFELRARAVRRLIIQ